MAKTPRTIKAPRIIDPEMTVRFLGDWFAPRSRYAVGQGITISNTRNGVSHSRQEIIPASVTQSLTSWQVSLSEDILSFHSAMHGRAFVHPLWTNGSTKLLTENNFGSSITGIPGVWFDMPQIDQKTLDLFMDFLCGTLVDLRPSIITGKPVAVIGTSHGQYGGVWAHDDARKSAHVAGAYVLDDLKLSVPAAQIRFANVHPVDDDEIAATLPEILTALAAATLSRDDRAIGE